jgi:hypothetical protein
MWPEFNKLIKSLLTHPLYKLLAVLDCCEKVIG